MTKPKYIQDKSGKFAGSVGVGANAVPTAAPAAPVSYDPLDHLEDTPEIGAAYAAMLAHQARKEPKVSPDTVTDGLRDLDALGETAISKVMEIRDAELHARTALRDHERAEAETLAAKQAEVHAAIQRAREEIRQARAFIEGDYIAAPEGTAVIAAADALSWEAMEAADAIVPADREEFLVDPAVRRRFTQANKHIETAKRVLAEALGASA